MIKERLGITEDNDYTNYINANKLNMKFDILVSGATTQISVNGSYYCDFIKDIAYSSDDFVYPLNSIKIKDTGINGIISFIIY